MKIILGIALIAFVQLSTFAQASKGLDSREAALQACEVIIEHFGKGASDLAFFELEKVWDVDEMKFEEFKTAIQGDIPKVMDRFGKPIGAMVVNEQLIEGLLYRVRTAIKYESYGMQMLFTFYKGKEDKWHLSNISWNDNLAQLLED